MSWVEFCGVGVLGAIFWDRCIAWRSDCVWALHSTFADAVSSSISENVGDLLYL